MVPNRPKKSIIAGVDFLQRSRELMKFLPCFICLLTLFPVHQSLADSLSGVSSWFLPQALSDQNTKIRFEVDSTWHLVNGTTSDVSGTIELAEKGNPSSVRASLQLPVAKLSTDSESRDERMREVMFESEHPFVKFEGKSLSGGCTPALVLRDGSCSDTLRGELSIVAETRSVEIPITISSSIPEGFLVRGKLPFKWADYGVEDPSILIARLDPVATVFFELSLLPETLEASRK